MDLARLAFGAAAIRIVIFGSDAATAIASESSRGRGRVVTRDGTPE